MRFSTLFLLASSVSAFAPSQPLQAGGRTTSLSAKPKVFIDGEAGTTGLQVRNRLESRDDLEIISPPSDLRKDPDTRKKFVNEADAVILCKSLERIPCPGRNTNIFRANVSIPDATG